MKTKDRFAVEISWRMIAISVLMLLSTRLAFVEEWRSAAPIPKGAEEVYGIAAGAPK